MPHPSTVLHWCGVCRERTRHELVAGVTLPQGALYQCPCKRLPAQTISDPEHKALVTTCEDMERAERDGAAARDRRDGNPGSREPISRGAHSATGRGRTGPPHSQSAVNGCNLQPAAARHDSAGGAHHEEDGTGSPKSRSRRHLTEAKTMPKKSPLQEAIATAVAEAVKPFEEKIAALEDQVEKLMVSPKEIQEAVEHVLAEQLGGTDGGGALQGQAHEVRRRRLPEVLGVLARGASHGHVQPQADDGWMN